VAHSPESQKVLPTTDGGGARREEAPETHIAATVGNLLKQEERRHGRAFVGRGVSGVEDVSEQEVSTPRCSMKLVAGPSVVAVVDERACLGGSRVSGQSGSSEVV
jgi:hypothetical protein